MGDLGESININLYRIVQEALTNISKHANARTVNVDLRAYRSGSAPDNVKNWVRLLIRDDGVGMPFAEHFSGLGVLGMRERVGALGGQIDIDSPPGGGTTSPSSSRSQRPMGSNHIKVLMIDDHEIVRAGYHRFLEKHTKSASLPRPAKPNKAIKHSATINPMFASSIYRYLARADWN